MYHVHPAVGQKTDAFRFQQPALDIPVQHVKGRFRTAHTVHHTVTGDGGIPAGGQMFMAVQFFMEPTGSKELTISVSLPSSS